MGVFCGMAVTVLGFRLMGPKEGDNFKHDEWHRRYGTLFKIGGPVLLLVGIYRLMSAYGWRPL